MTLRPESIDPLKPFICPECEHPLMVANEVHDETPLVLLHCIFCAPEDCELCKQKREAYQW